MSCIFPFKCIETTSAIIIIERGCPVMYKINVNQHSATYVVLLSAYEVVDVNG